MPSTMERVTLTSWRWRTDQCNWPDKKVDVVVPTQPHGPETVAPCNAIRGMHPVGPQ